MWAIIKAILAYVVCRIVLAMGMILVLAGNVKGTSQSDLVIMASTMDHWSFWVSLAVALYVLCKSW